MCRWPMCGKHILPLFLLAFLFLVVRPLLLVAMPFAPSSEKALNIL